MKKRVISFILTLTMLLSIAVVLPVTAGAVGDVWDGTASAAFTGDGTEVSPYVISSGANLKYLQVQVNGGNQFIGKYIVLANDIDLGGREWTPIGSKRTKDNAGNKSFAGNFDGQGYTVKGLSITTNSQQYLGLFGVLGVGIEGTTTSEAVIKNLTVEGEINLDLDDITVALDIGGLVGFTEGKSADYKAKIENCISKVNVTFDLDKLSKAIFTGGIGGRIHTYADVTDCATYGNIDVTVRGTKNQPRVGGLAGATTNYCDFTRVVNYGNVISATNVAGQDNIFVGGLLGARASTAGQVKLNYCANFGNVTAINGVNQQTTAGGLIGSLQGPKTTFNNCYNSGAVHAEMVYVEGSTSEPTGAGGIVGYVYGEEKANNSIIQNSYNNGKITVGEGYGDYAGGIVGKAPASEGSIIENCKTTTSLIVDNQTIAVSDNEAGISHSEFEDLARAIDMVIGLNLRASYGASVRLGTPTGLRFSGSVIKAYIDDLEAEYGADNVSFGMIIAPTAYVTAAGEFTIEALTTAGKTYKVIEAKSIANIEDASTDGYYKFNAVLSNIIKNKTINNYIKEFSAITYIKIVDGVNEIYEYSPVSATRSIDVVAEKALDDLSDTETVGYGHLIESGTNAGKYSPYDVDQRGILLGFTTGTQE